MTTPDSRLPNSIPPQFHVVGFLIANVSSSVAIWLPWAYLTFLSHTLWTVFVVTFVVVHSRIFWPLFVRYFYTKTFAYMVLAVTMFVFVYNVDYPSGYFNTFFSPPMQQVPHRQWGVFGYLRVLCGTGSNGIAIQFDLAMCLIHLELVYGVVSLVGVIRLLTRR